MKTNNASGGTKVLFLSLLGGFLGVGCGDRPLPSSPRTTGSGPEVPTVTGPELDLTSQPIINGEAPNQLYHDAVVGLLIEYGTTAYICTGTLITPTVVLTAAHCVEGAPTAVWVTFDNAISWSGNNILAAQVLHHAGYDGNQLVNDIALLRLPAPVVGVTPVPYLPAAQDLTAADAGGWVNFAGFGQDETGASGLLLQADWTMGGVNNPCTYYTIRGRRVATNTGNCMSDPPTQVWYSQRALHDNGDGTVTVEEIGPCFGDSGGPMFVNRAGTIHVAGVTSYGDNTCKLYGVSTRPAAFACWIEEFVQQTSGLCGEPPPPPPPECTVNADCDDGNGCNGAESCDAAGNCQAGTPVVCDDGNACTSNVCSPGTGTCSYPDNGSCGSCQALGSGCTANSQCCSNNCRGSKNSKTCK